MDSSDAGEDSEADSGDAGADSGEDSDDGNSSAGADSDDGASNAAADSDDGAPSSSCSSPCDSGTSAGCSKETGCSTSSSVFGLMVTSRLFSFMVFVNHSMILSAVRSPLYSCGAFLFTM